MKIGRNDPCTCGSGRKYKQCCMLKEQQAAKLEQVVPLLKEAESSYVSGHQLRAGQCCERVLEVDPANEIALNLLGLLAQQDGRMQIAHDYFERAVAANDQNVDWSNNLAASKITLGHYQEAVPHLVRALQLRPTADIHNTLGVAFEKQHKLNDAICEYRKAVELKSNSAPMWNNLGHALTNIGQFNEASQCLHRALSLAPSSIDVLLNLGNVQVLQGLRVDGLASFLQILKLAPNHGPTHNNIGNLLQSQGQLVDASDHYRRAIELSTGPLRFEMLSSFLFHLTQLDSLNPSELLAEHLSAAKEIEAMGVCGLGSHLNSKLTDRVLRVGFVSGDLRNHAVASFIEPVLIHLAKSAGLQLYAYSNHPNEDSVSVRLKGYFAHWLLVHGLSDEMLSQRIQEDAIDILIDLSGHTALNRLPTFARKPAPVQISWIGYPGTTGLRAMDYFLADRFYLPAGQFDDQFTEKIVQLPAAGTFLPHATAPPVNALPALTNGFITFGSFNRISKISREVVTLWAKILNALPDSRMVLGAMPKDGGNDTLIKWFAQEGVDASRLTVYGVRPMDDYLALHHEVDICLDTFPYNGGTTSWHAVWMGVPTLTMHGQTAAGRSGAVIVGHTGLDGYGAHDHNDFVAKGLARAQNIDALSVVRAGLREKFRRSAPGQPEVVAAGLESALRTMWRRWCSGLPSASFEIGREVPESMRLNSTGTNVTDEGEGGN